MALLHADLLAAQHPRLPQLHGHRRRAEDLGQHDGDHHDRGLGARGRRPGDRRVRPRSTPRRTRRAWRPSRCRAGVRRALPRLGAARASAQPGPAAGATPPACSPSATPATTSSNSSRALNADFLEVIYRMAAGELPERRRLLRRPATRAPYSLDRVGLQALARVGRLVARAPAARPGAARLHLSWPCRAASRGRARCRRAPRVTRARGAGAPGAGRASQADERGGFERALGAGHPLEARSKASDAAVEPAPLWLRAVAAGRRRDAHRADRRRARRARRQRAARLRRRRRRPAGATRAAASR